jgi:hypothetical protein
MSNAFEKMKVEHAREMAFDCYDNLKMDFKTTNPEQSDQIQRIMYEALIDYAHKNNIDTHEMLVIVKQLLLNMCAMTAEVILDSQQERITREAQEDLK